MKIFIIGRTAILYNTMCALIQAGFEVVGIITAKASIEEQVGEEVFAELAEQKKIPYLFTFNINNDDGVAFIKKCVKADIAVSMNYVNIISQEVINLFSFGILNIHGGDLPRYRGNACQAWAIINGEDKIGLCVHKMIGGELDSGDIIARKYLPLDINTRIGEIYEWMSIWTPKLFLDALEKLQRDSQYVLDRQSSDWRVALRCYPRCADDGRINWGVTNEKILRLVNASSEPYPGAFCSYHAEKIIIWRARLYKDNEKYCAVPGQVVGFNRIDESVVIACGFGKLEILEVEYKNIRGKSLNFIRSTRDKLV